MFTYLDSLRFRYLDINDGWHREPEDFVLFIGFVDTAPSSNVICSLIQDLLDIHIIALKQ
jgi:hypothetical protein